MSFSLFKKIFDKWGDLFSSSNKYIPLGGGEPTIHPNFWEMLCSSMYYGIPWLATNGKNTDSMIILERLARIGKIAVALSLDKWHDKIDKKVVDLFKKDMVESEKYKGFWYPVGGRNGADRREIRGWNEPYYGGRWKNKTITKCTCRTVRVNPEGMIYLCGCVMSDIEACPLIGTVDDGIYEKFKYVDLVNSSHCYRDYEINKEGYYSLNSS
jgi:hypothetical protein